MRLIALSDIHGNLTAFETVLNDIQRLGAYDHLWILGDVAAFGARPAECLRHVKALLDQVETDQKNGIKRGVRAIRGNTDRYLVNGSRHTVKPAEDADGLDKIRQKIERDDKSLQWSMAQLTYEDYEVLKKLGGECDLTVPDYGAVIGYHAVPGDDEGYLKFDTPDDEAIDVLLDREGRLGVGGHLHVQFDRPLANSLWRVINIGSVGMSNDKPGYAQYGVFTFEDGALSVDLRAIPYDVEAAIQDAHDMKFPALDWLTNLYRNGK